MLTLRAYRLVCLAGVALGLAMAVSSFASGDAFMGWFFVLFTLMLGPAYLAYRAAIRRRGG